MGYGFEVRVQMAGVCGGGNSGKDGLRSSWKIWGRPYVLPQPYLAHPCKGSLRTTQFLGVSGVFSCTRLVLV